jgi:hypothetical protein
MKQVILAAALTLFTAPAAFAQQAKPVEAKEAEAPPARSAGTRNVNVELTITDQSTAADAAKKTIAMIIADGSRGSIRTSGVVHTPAEGKTSVVLNVDARPLIRSDNSVNMALTIEYFPKPDAASEAKDVPRTQLNQMMSMNLESGKPTIISQAADPVGNRKVTVEVKATILK